MNVNLFNLLDKNTEDDLIACKALTATDPGRRFFKLLERMKESLMRDVTKAPMRSDELNKDVAWKLGQIELIDQILELPERSMDKLRKRASE